MHFRLERSRSFACLFGLSPLFLGIVSPPARPPAGEPRSYSIDQVKLAALGKALFNDKSLSEPAGMGCVSCHSPETGFSYPNSILNAYFGPVKGVVNGRAGDRKPPSAAYAPYLPTGVPHYDNDAIAWVGGLFWDGRASDAVAQAKGPFLNPNEMNNLVHELGSPKSVVDKIKKGPNALLFKEVFGEKVFLLPVTEVYDLVARSIVAFEASPEVSPFTSKYDAYLEGKAQLTPKELLGLRLTTGTLNGRPNGIPFRKSAHCMDCHGTSEDLTKAPDIWTNSCYANLGVPRNNANPYYRVTDSRSNPRGFNSYGKGYVDLGLGGFLYPFYGLSPGDPEHGDPLRINGAFKAPTLRNVDKRPYPGFVKSYMHNGVFKTLKDVVHFYNTRNLTTEPGEVIDYTKSHPYEGLKGKPLWGKPEYMDRNTLINPTGMGAGPGSRTASAPVGDLDAMQIGNLLLTDDQEDAIVAFLKTLSDGYFVRETPHPWIPETRIGLEGRK